MDRGTRVVPGRLRITGRRINGPAPPLRAHVPSGYGEGARLQAPGLIFKTEGCWRGAGGSHGCKAAPARRPDLIGTASTSEELGGASGMTSETQKAGHAARPLRCHRRRSALRRASDSAKTGPPPWIQGISPGQGGSEHPSGGGISLCVRNGLRREWNGPRSGERGGEPREHQCPGRWRAPRLR